MDRANQTTEARKPRNPLKRGRWAGEKSRVRASIVGPMSDRGYEMRKRGANKNQLWTSQGSCRIEDRDEYQGDSSEGKTRL